MFTIVAFPMKLPSHPAWVEYAFGAFTLIVSFWIAFGPLRHRLPKFLTRMAKWSAAFKLIVLSGMCWLGLYRNVTNQGPHALRWALTVVGLALIAGAVYVLTRPSAPSAAPKPPKP